MLPPLIDLEALGRMLSDPRPDGSPLVLVDLDSGPLPSNPLGSQVSQVVVGVSAALAPAGASVCDVVLVPEDPALEAVRRTVTSNPLASVALVQVLRGAEGRAADEGLVLESATYSTLQAGPEFARWRAARPAGARRPKGGPPPVALDRRGSVLDITLRRPHVHNALNTEMRDALVEAFGLVALDDSIVEVHLRGAGPSFCAGGDLLEFGSFIDPASAHLVRLTQSVGRAVARVADRVTAHLHGACRGSGIELPAFTGKVVATPDASIGLPELGLGLIPGAGGTVSIPRRIGRHRTALLALTGEPISATQALEWGLVDAVEDGPPAGLS